MLTAIFHSANLRLYPRGQVAVTEGPMKVFLSHSTKDADFVKQLAAAIIGAGSEPWLCELDVEKHEHFVAEIEKGLKWCDVALLRGRCA